MPDLPYFAGTQKDFHRMPAEMQQSIAGVSASLAQQTEAFVRTLRQQRPPAGALEILRLAVIVAEKAVTQMMGTRKFACEKGCSYCCYLKVEAFDHEVYGIVAHLLTTWSMDDVLALYRRLEEKVAQSAGLNPQAYLEKKISCVFLSEEGTCRVYSVRPIACVAYHSMSKEECISAHENPAAPWVTQVAEIIIGVHGVSLGVVNVVEPTLMSKPRKENPPNLHEMLLPVLRERIKSCYGLRL